MHLKEARDQLLDTAHSYHESDPSPSNDFDVEDAALAFAVSRLEAALRRERADTVIDCRKLSDEMIRALSGFLMHDYAPRDSPDLGSVKEISESLLAEGRRRGWPEDWPHSI